MDKYMNLVEQYDRKYALLSAVAMELDPQSEIAINSYLTETEAEIVLHDRLEPGTKIDWRLHDQLLSEVKGLEKEADLLATAIEAGAYSE